MLEMAIAEVCMSMTALPRTMVVADLGCSCGPNALLFVSEVICTVADRLKTFGHNPVEIQFFLNDLPGNDFNHVFRSLAEFHMCMAEEGSAEGGDQLPAYYIAGLPGSFYRRLLPCRSVHLFHSSYCLMWCSQVFTDAADDRLLCKFWEGLSRFISLRHLPDLAFCIDLKHRSPRSSWKAST